MNKQKLDQADKLKGKKKDSPDEFNEKKKQTNKLDSLDE